MTERAAEQPASMLSQLRDIGDRYLQRTLRDANQLQEFLAQALAGDAGCIRQIEQLAHKIHGSGAMFGFERVSEYAGQIERLVAEPAVVLAAVSPELQSLVAHLQEAVRAAATERGIEP